jgi:Zn-dependent protease
VIHDNAFIDAVAFLAILIPSIVLHELSHGWVAERFGDPTARQAGRLTLNPVRHVDPMGSLVVPGLLALSGQTVFGWAKPVPVQPAHFARPTGTMALVALAGPATNLALALVIGRLGPFVDLETGAHRGVVLVSSLGIGLTGDSLWARLAFGALVLNAALAVFNMLPIPPLDGSRLVPLVLPPAGRALWARASQYGFVVLLLLIFVFEGALGFMGDVIGWLARLAV